MCFFFLPRIIRVQKIFSSRTRERRNVFRKKPHILPTCFSFLASRNPAQSVRLLVQTVAAGGSSLSQVLYNNYWHKHPQSRTGALSFTTLIANHSHEEERGRGGGSQCRADVNSCSEKSDTERVSRSPPHARVRERVREGSRETGFQCRQTRVLHNSQ